QVDYRQRRTVQRPYFRQLPAEVVFLDVRYSVCGLDHEFSICWHLLVLDFRFFILTQYGEVPDLAKQFVQRQIVIPSPLPLDVDMNGIFVRLSYDGDRLDFGQVDVVVLEGHQRVGEASNRVRNFKAERCLVTIRPSVPSPLEHQESGKILFMRLDSLFEDGETKLSSCEFVGDGRCGL